MLEVACGCRCHHEPHAIHVLGNGEADIFGLFARTGAVERVVIEVEACAVLQQSHITQSERTCSSVGIGVVAGLVGKLGKGVAVVVLNRITVGKEFCAAQGCEVSGHFCSCSRHLKGNDVETCGLWTAGVCHLIALIGEDAAVVESSDVVVAIGNERLHIIGGGMHGKLEMELVEFFHRESFIVHQYLVEVLVAGLVGVPDVGNSLDVAILLAEPYKEHIGLIAMPLVGEGIVVGVGEEVACARHREILVGEGLTGLPVGCGLPDGSTVSDGSVEACVDAACVAVIAILGIAHIMEGVTHFVCHSRTYGLAGGRVQPEGRHLEVITASVASPGLGVVEQHHNLVLGDVGTDRIDKAQLVDFQLVVFFQFLLHVVEVEVVVVGGSEFVGSCVAPSFVPEDDEVVGLYGASLRPGVFAVGVGLFVEQGVAGPRVFPFVRDIDGFLSESRRCAQEERC